MRPIGLIESPSTQHNDCVLVVGVSRPKLAVVFLTVMLVSLFLTFHVLYDSAVYSIQVNYLSNKTEKKYRKKNEKWGKKHNRKKKNYCPHCVKLLSTQLSFIFYTFYTDYAFEIAMQSTYVSF